MSNQEIKSIIQEAVSTSEMRIINIIASIIVSMKRYFPILLIFLIGCNPSTLSEWRVEGVSIVRDLVEELESVKTLKDLEAKKSSIKKIHYKSYFKKRY